MIDSNEYIIKVKDYFEFLQRDFDFKLLEEKVRGNVFYDIKYKDDSRVVSISYENIEDYLLVIVFMLQNGNMPDYDDKSKTLHLKQLNKLIISKASKEELHLNTEYFAQYNANNEFERKLLKEAKELRLCLKYFNIIKSENDMLQ